MARQLSKCVIMISWEHNGVINESAVEVPAMDRRQFEKGVSNLAKMFGVGKRKLKKHMSIMWGVDKSDLYEYGEPVEADKFASQQEVAFHEHIADLEEASAEQSTVLS